MPLPFQTIRIYNMIWPDYGFLITVTLEMLVLVAVDVVVAIQSRSDLSSIIHKPHFSEGKLSTDESSLMFFNYIIITACSSQSSFHFFK